MTNTELAAAIGEPVIIYEDLTSERSVLAYPVLGIEAQTLADPVLLGAAVDQIRRGASQTVQSYLDTMRGRSDVRIIKAP